MNANEAKRIAAAIVDDLFANGFGERGYRLSLRDADERSLGGWCRQAVADRVERILLAPAKSEKE